MKSVFLVTLVLAACAAPARQQTVAHAFAPLIGCWRGEFVDQPDITDERCFQAMGESVVDTHAVRPTPYAGETTYHLDETSGEIVFAYASNDGGRINGSVQREGARYIFPPHVHRSADGTELRLRAEWTVQDSEHYSAVTEREEAGRWRAFMRIDYVRAADLAAPP